MRLTVALVVLVGLLAVGADPEGDNLMHFALSSKCHLFLSKTSDSLKSSIGGDHEASSSDIDCTNAIAIYTPPTSETSLFVLLPKDKHQIYIYGRTFSSSTSDVFVDVAAQLELVDYEYALDGTECEFQTNSDFYAFFDRNHLYLSVKCPEYDAFIVAQAVSYLKTVWTPDIELIPLRAREKYTDAGLLKAAAFPAPPHDPYDTIDSGVVHHVIDGTTLKGYVAPLHQLRNGNPPVIQEKKLTEVTGTIQRLYFVHSKLYIVKSDAGFFAYRAATDIPDFFTSLIKEFTFADKVEFQPEHKIVYYGRAEPADNNEFEHWKFRTNYDPSLDERFGDPVDCGFDEFETDLKKCKKNLKSRKTTHIVMYCLMAFEFVIIMATLAIFTLCIFKQRKRRKRHHDKKRNKKNKKDKKDTGKTDDPAASTNNTNNPSSAKNSDKI
uniref:Uncharacterized protein n=1 Tax=Panagrellus redivivus TaxID=6233 RepID=A0A7E4VXS5_PANRE